MRHCHCKHIRLRRHHHQDAFIRTLCLVHVFYFGVIWVQSSVPVFPSASGKRACLRAKKVNFRGCKKIDIWSSRFRPSFLTRARQYVFSKSTEWSISYVNTAVATKLHFQLFLTGGGVIPDSVSKKSLFEREIGWSGLGWSSGQ